MSESGGETITVFAVARVVTKIKLAAVAVQVFARHLMIDADDAAFEKRPKVFHAVDVNLTARVLFFPVIHALVSGKGFVQAVVCAPLVGHDRGLRRDISFDDALQRVGVDIFYGLSLHGFIVAVKHAENRRFVFRTAPALAAFSLAADVGFIGFNDAIKRLVKIFGAHGVADAVQKMPSGFLRDANVFAELHGRDALLVRGDHIHGVKPLLQRERAVFENCTDAHGKFFPAIGALEEFAAVKHVNFAVTPAMHTNGLIAPTFFRHKSVAGFFRGKTLLQVFQRELVRIDFLCGHGLFLCFVRPQYTKNLVSCQVYNCVRVLVHVFKF